MERSITPCPVEQWPQQIQCCVLQILEAIASRKQGVVVLDTWFEGIDALKELVERAGYSGGWEKTENGWRFRSNRRHVLNWYETTGKVLIQGRDSDAFKAALMMGTQAKEIVPPRKTNGQPDAKIFVVHGHDDQAREQLELILMKLGLQPFILMNSSGGGRTIIEALEHQIYERSAYGIVLMTPDDYGYSKLKADADRQPRARQNVILEAGMIMAALGRDRMAVLKKGALEIPSDLDGFLRLEFNDHVKEIVPKLVQSMSEAGIEVDHSRIAQASA